MRRTLERILSRLSSIRSDARTRKRPTATPEEYGPTWLGKGIFYLSRLTVNPLIRRWAILVLGMWIGRTRFSSQSAHPLLESLTNDGLVRLDQSLTALQCNEIAAHLSDKLVRDKTGSVVRKSCEVQAGDMSLGFHSLEDVLECPHIMEFVGSPPIVQLAAQYFLCAPTLAGVVVQWSFPSSSPSVAQQFHRDSEDWKYLRFIVYLSDVDEGAGPHVFIKGSHRDKLPFRLRFYPVQQLLQRYGADRFIKVCGKRGTGVAVDTSGIHKGELPTTTPRMVLIFTYSLFAQPFFRYKPICTRHSAALKTYSNRLFLR